MRARLYRLLALLLPLACAALIAFDILLICGARP